MLMAYLALFQIATFKGWIDIMDDAVDSVKVNIWFSHLLNNICIFTFS